MTRASLRGESGLARALILFVSLALLAVGGVLAIRWERPPAPRAGVPVVSITPTPSVAGPTSTPTRTTEPSHPPAATATPTPSSSPRGPDIAMYARLGAWVDLWDYPSLDAAVAVADMKQRGVRTLYLQTSRYTCPASPPCPDGEDFGHPDSVDAWLDAAHEAGIAVVGWYLPGYADMERDVRRTLAIARYRSGAGNRFDSVAVDIEAHEEIGAGRAFNDAVVEHLRRVRRALGRSYPLGAITPPPVGMALAPTTWAGFPWAAIGRYSDVVLPMAYWSYRRTCPQTPAHCPEQYGERNTAEVRRLTGRPVHAVGGIGDAITTEQLADFVRGARRAGAIGGSLYDYVTTESSFWAPLSRFNRG